MKISFSMEELLWMKRGFEIDNEVFGKPKDNTVLLSVSKKIDSCISEIQDALDAIDGMEKKQ